MPTSHLIGFIIVVEICVSVESWAGLQWVRGSKVLEVKSGETEIFKHTTDDQKKHWSCDLGATTVSYTLYFLCVVMGIFFLSGISQIILKTGVCGNHVEEIFPS